MTTLVRSAGSLVGGLLRSPALLVRANRLFKAINAQDVQSVAECIGDGSFFDPLLDAPVSGKAAVAEHLQVLLKAFPDFKIEPDHISVGARSVNATVTVSGTNLGPIPGKLGFDEVPATGKAISIPACVVLENDRGRLNARIVFDSKAFGEALGFQVFILPQRIDQFQFGAWYRMKGPSNKLPQAAAVTTLSLNDPSIYYGGVLPKFGTGVLSSIASMPGCISVLTGMNEPDEKGEQWLFTLSLWESLEATEQILGNEQHKKAVGMFMKDHLGYATASRVFSLQRAKPMMVACSKCGKKNNAHKPEHVCSACGTELPPAPELW